MPQTDYTERIVCFFFYSCASATEVVPEPQDHDFNDDFQIFILATMMKNVYLLCRLHELDPVLSCFV